jgi:hypothetical protein
MFVQNVVSRSLVTTAIAAAVLGTASAPAMADVSLLEKDGLKVDGALVAGAAAFSSPNANFGAGTFSNNNGSLGKRRGTANWFEYFLSPELKAAYETPAAGTLYGDVSAMLVGTGGTGDASVLSTTAGTPWDIAVENLYAGWKSGTVFANLGENAVDISAGRQSFRVADGFLISSGTFNAGKRAGFWEQARTAFKETGIVRLNTNPVRADLFYLQNNSAQSQVPPNLDFAKTRVAGGNVEWFSTVAPAKEGEVKDGASVYADRQWYVGGTFFHAFDAKSDGTFAFNNSGLNNTADNAAVTNTLTSNRDGMNVFSAHVGGSPIPAVPDFSFYGNYVYENNRSANRKVDANAWYVEPGYTFSEAPWTPKVAYRYAHFSGDKNPSNTTKTAYDPFFFNATTRGYGTWFIGEIMGNYFISNSNVNVNQLTLSVNPTDALKLSLLGYVYNWDQKTQFGNNVTSDSLAKELDLVAEYTVNDHVSLAGSLAAAQSGLGGRQFLQNQVGAGGGEDRTWYLGEVSVTVKF